MARVTSVCQNSELGSFKKLRYRYKRDATTNDETVRLTASEVVQKDELFYLITVIWGLLVRCSAKNHLE